MRSQAEPADPWFAPADKPGTNGGQAPWFLPAGRAGLHPDSITESWDDSGAEQAEPATRAAAAGAPPWGRESASAAGAEPPPWETGPWPGPGEEALAPRAPAGSGPDAPGLAADGLEPGRERRRFSRPVMLGGAGVVVLVVVVLIIVGVTGGSPGGCATYPAAVRQAYAHAMSDLSDHAPASVQGADLERAASLANASAVAAGNITARTALFAMASDLDDASTAVTDHRPLTPDLLQRLTADGSALPRSCPG